MNPQLGAIDLADQFANFIVLLLEGFAHVGGELSNRGSVFINGRHDFWSDSADDISAGESVKAGAHLERRDSSTVYWPIQACGLPPLEPPPPHESRALR